jgi:GTP-binding protein Era
VVCISALKQSGIEDLLQAVLKYLPEGEPFFAEDELTDLSERFFVGEMIREKIYDLFRRRDSLPHHRCRLRVQAKIVSAEDRRNIIVQRETQKAIIIGEGGNMIKRSGRKPGRHRKICRTESVPGVICKSAAKVAGERPVS